jgi:ribonucleoside-diphosphate reductase alpha chain
MTSGIQFYNGISTQEIQEILIRSASDLINLDHPNYQYVAARLLLFAVRKQLYGRMKELPTLEDHIYTCVNAQVYDSEIFNKYSKEEIERVNSWIDHDRDYLFTYARSTSRALISTSCKIEALVEYMKPLNSCT